jgi:CHAD domain-containing protein
MKFRLRRRKPVRRTICKLFAFHLERCRSLLARGDEVEAGRIHEARRSIKRLRALVSLVRSGLGDDAKWFNRNLRDINRALSPVRDAEALREAFDQLIAGQDEPPDEFAAVRARLLSWTDQHERLSTVACHQAIEQLARVEARWQRTKIDGRGWLLLEQNVQRAYKRSRRAALRLTRTADVAEFHEFRKLAKQTQYHWEFLEPIWTDRVRAELDEFESLTDTLGRLHDGVLLRDWIQAPEQWTLSRRARRLMRKHVERQQRVLQREACRLAPRCFAESPGSVIDRLQRYWQAFRQGDHEPSLSPPNRKSTAMQTSQP